MVDSLGESLEFLQGGRLSNPGDFVLDPGRQPGVELMAECAISPVGEEGSKSIPLHQVFCDPLAVLHLEISKAAFSIGDRVERPKVELQFVHKSGEAGLPKGTPQGTRSGVQEIGLKPR